jgi:hypothetical protein
VQDYLNEILLSLNEGQMVHCGLGGITALQFVI